MLVYWLGLTFVLAVLLHLLRRVNENQAKSDIQASSTNTNLKKD